MNNAEFKGDWEELNCKIRKEFAEFTKEKQKVVKVQKEEMLRKVELMGEITKEELGKSGLLQKSDD